MSDMGNSDLIRAQRLRDEGKYDEALELLGTLEQRRDLSTTDQLECRLLKCTILTRRGKFEEALLLAEQVLNESQDRGLHLHAVDALSGIADTLYRLGRYDETLEVIAQGEQLLTTLVHDSAATPKVRGVIRRLLSRFIKREPPRQTTPSSILEPVRPSDISDQSSSLKQRRASLLFRKGAVYLSRGERNQAREIIQQSLALYRELGNKLRVAGALLNLGIIHASEWDFDQAIEHYHQSLKIYEDIGAKHSSHFVLSNIGDAYRLKGDLDQAQEHYLKGLAIVEKLGYTSAIAQFHTHLGATLFQRGDLDRAQDYLERGWKIREESGNKSSWPESLIRLIMLAIEQNALEQAQHYLSRLKEVHEALKNNVTSQIYRVSEAMVLKTSTRTIHRARAEELLTQVVDEDVIIVELYIVALLNLCDLLLVELRTSGNPSVLTELQTRVNRLLDIARQQNSYWMLAEAYVLQARLALLELDLEKARRLFTQAQIIAEEQGLRRLALTISSEHDTLLEQLSKWEDLISRQASYEERAELARLEEMVVRMIRKRVLDSPEELEEEPVLFLILAESGVCVFSMSLLPDSTLNTQLVSGFLTAIHGFSEQVFSQALDRAKLGDHTLLMQAVTPLLLCYVCKGQSYAAQRKLQKFSEIAQGREALWKMLQKASQKGRILDGEDYTAVENLLKETFPP